MRENNCKVYNVSSDTDAKKLGDSIYQFYKEVIESPDPNKADKIELISVGAGALNNSVKASIIANKNLIAFGKFLFSASSFKTIDKVNNFTGISIVLHLSDI